MRAPGDASVIGGVTVGPINARLVHRSPTIKIKEFSQFLRGYCHTNSLIQIRSKLRICLNCLPTQPAYSSTAQCHQCCQWQFARPPPGQDLINRNSSEYSKGWDGEEHM